MVLSVPDEFYSRKASCTLTLISTVLYKCYLGKKDKSPLYKCAGHGVTVIVWESDLQPPVHLLPPMAIIWLGLKYLTYLASGTQYLLSNTPVK